jgi:hypothetical protein
MTAIAALLHEITQQQRIHDWLLRFPTQMTEVFGPGSRWGDLTLARKGDERASFLGNHRGGTSKPVASSRGAPKGWDGKRRGKKPSESDCLKRFSIRIRRRQRGFAQDG